MKTDVILNLFNRISTAVFKIVVFGIVARLIGVEEFGKFILLTSIFTVLSQIMMFGSEYSILNVQKKLDFSLLLIYTFFKTILAIIVFYIISLIFVDNFESISIALFVGSQILFFLMQSIYLKFDKYLHFVLVNTIINIAPIVLLLILPVEESYFALLITAIPKFILIFFALFYIRNIDFKLIYQVRYIYNNSFKFVVFEQLKFIHHRFDIILLSILQLNYFAGLVGAIKNFVEFSQYLPKTIQVIIYKYKQNISIIMKYSYLLLTIFFFVFLIILSIYGDMIINFIFGSEFEIISKGLLVSMIGAYFYSLSHINMSILINQYSRINRINIIIVLIFIFNYTIFIFHLDYLGAILGFTLSSFFYFLITLIMIIKYQRKSYRSEFN